MPDACKVETMPVPNLFAMPQLPEPRHPDAIADWLVAIACEDSYFNYVSLNHFNVALLAIAPGFHLRFMDRVRHQLRQRPEVAARVSRSLFGCLLFGNADRRLLQMKPMFPSHMFAYALYSSFAYAYGSDQARGQLRTGKLTMLSLRKSSSTLANKGLGSYDDTLIVLKNQLRSVAYFPICTEPGAQYSQRAAPAGPKSKAPTDDRYKDVTYRKTDGVDINNDKIRDAGRLVEGTYVYYEKAGGYLGDRAFQVKIAQIAERDTDGDGLFTTADNSRIDLAGAGTSMYIHRGGDDTATNPNTWSAGCQTIPKNRYGQFLSHVAKGSTFPYVLLNVS